MTLLQLFFLECWCAESLLCRLTSRASAAESSVAEWKRAHAQLVADKASLEQVRDHFIEPLIEIVRVH